MNKYQHTLEKLENNTAKRSIILVIEGALIGVLAGLTAVLYRYCLTYAESGLYAVLNFIRGNAGVTALWFAALILMGCIVAKIVKGEPMAAGSGIPQVSGEVRGYLDQSFWRVVLAKFTGGTLSIFGGLSLGREGPSIQLGAMVAKSYSRLRNYDKTTVHITSPHQAWESFMGINTLVVVPIFKLSDNTLYMYSYPRRFMGSDVNQYSFNCISLELLPMISNLDYRFSPVAPELCGLSHIEGKYFTCQLNF